MKHFLSSIVFILVSLVSFSQISRGESFITGSLGFKLEDDRNSYLSGYDFSGAVKISTFEGSLSYQFFLAKGFALGPSIGWELQKAVFDELVNIEPFEFRTVSTAFNKELTPGFTMSYHIPVDDRFFFYLSSTSSWFYSKYELEETNNEQIQEGRGFKIDLQPGMCFFVTKKKKLSVRMEVGNIFYSKIYPKDQPESFISEFNVDFHPANFSIGAQWHFLRSAGSQTLEKEKKRKVKKEKLTPLFDDN